MELEGPKSRDRATFGYCSIVGVGDTVTEDRLPDAIVPTGPI